MYKSFCYLFNRRDRLRFLGLIIIMLGGSIVEMGTIGMVPLYVSVLIGKTKFSGNGMLSRLMSRLNEFPPEKFAIYGGIALGVVFIGRTLYSVFNNIIHERVIRNRQVALMSKVFKAYMDAPYLLFRTRNSSAIIDYVIYTTGQVISLVLGSALNFIRDLTMMLGVLGVLIWFDPCVSICSFFSLALIGITFMYTASKNMKRMGKEEYRGRLSAAKAVSEGVGIYREATVMGCKDYFIKVFHNAAQMQAKGMRKSHSIQRSVWPCMELIVVAVLLTTMGVLLAYGRGIQAVAPTLALIAVSLARLKGCFTQIMTDYNNMRIYSTVIIKLADELKLLESAGEMNEKCDKKIEFRKKIQIDNVSFAYPDSDTPIISNATFDIEYGTSVAFVGKTGSGKSTMATILLGLFKPDSGRLLVDGVDIFSNLKSWQSLIGFVPQDIFLTDNTIRANIAIGTDEDKVDEEQLHRAIKAANLDEFIESLPEKENTIVGERGIRLSGGQKQRVGIARALYHNPKVLIFDEATSALDNDTETSVMEAIEELKGSHTLIIVAHRLTTVRECSKIYSFSQNGVTAFNSLEEYTSVLSN